MIRDRVIRYRSAIQEEIDFIKKDLRKRGANRTLIIDSAQKLSRTGSGYLYSVKVSDLENTIQADTATVCQYGKRVYKGSLENCNVDEQLLVVEFEEKIPKKVSGGRIQFDLTYLLVELSNKLQNIIDQPRIYSIRSIQNLFAEDWDCETKPSSQSYDLNPSQLHAVETSLGSDVCILWGPPGTGKTKTLAALVHEFVLAGKTVLVTSHTNIAVNTLMMRINKHRKKYGSDYRIARIGYVPPEFEHEVPTIDNVIEEMFKDEYPAVVDEINQYCEFVLKEERKESLFLNVLKEAVSSIDIIENPELVDQGRRLISTFKRFQKEAIPSISVLGTTITKMYISESLEDHRFDVVIFDEASMAIPPQIFYAASIAEEKIILGGDFNQLPPIVRADSNLARSELGTDIFSVLGVSDPYGSFSVRPILDIQYRMHPDICTIVNQLFYGGKVRTNTHIFSNIKQSITTTRPLYLIDSSNTYARGKHTKSSSRHNQYHAKLIASLLESYSGKNSVGIITPYRAQRKMIMQEIYKKIGSSFDTYPISVNTIHSFQGQEKDVIIVDLVDTPEARSIFLSSLENISLRNLINVAVSRAMKQLIIVAHRDHFTRTLPSEEIAHMFQIIDRWGTVIEISDLTNPIPISIDDIGWPSSQRILSIDEIHDLIKPSTFIQWAGKTLPVIEVSTKDVNVIMNTDYGSRKFWIPIHEIEAIHQGSDIISTLSGSDVA